MDQPDRLSPEHGRVQPLLLALDLLLAQALRARSLFARQLVTWYAIQSQYKRRCTPLREWAAHGAVDAKRGGEVGRGDAYGGVPEDHREHDPVLERSAYPAISLCVSEGWAAVTFMRSLVRKSTDWGTH